MLDKQVSADGEILEEKTGAGMTCLTDAWLQCYSLETCLAVWDCSEMTYAASFVLQPMSQK